MTSSEHKTLLLLEEQLVYAGVHPSIAGKAILRAADRVFRAREAGMGKVQQTRRIRHELPGVPPRIQTGGSCRHIQASPGQEEKALQEVSQLEQQGWNVMEVRGGGGWPRLRTWYACPPGQLPMEAQQQVLQSEPWGAPLYVS